MKLKYIFLIIGSAACACGTMSCTSVNRDKEMKTVTITSNTIQSAFQAKPDESINFAMVEEHSQKYPERWEAVFKFLTNTDLKTLDTGRIDLSEDVFAAVSEYDTKNPEDAKFESHRKYIDLQYIVEGQELIGLTNNNDLKVISPYDESKDILFYDFEGGNLILASPSNYFIFFPEDKHRPCIKTEEITKVKKLVVKIRYN